MSDQVIESLATVLRNLHGLFSTFLIATFFFLIFSSLLTSVGVIVFNSLIDDAMNLANPYIESLNVTSSCLASYVWTQELFSDDPLIPYSRAELKAKSNYYAEQLITHFNTMLFGKNESEFTPGILLGSDIITHFAHSKSTVDLRSSTFTPLYGMLHDVYFSMSCDAQMR